MSPVFSYRGLLTKHLFSHQFRIKWWYHHYWSSILAPSFFFSQFDRFHKQVHHSFPLTMFHIFWFDLQALVTGPYVEDFSNMFDLAIFFKGFENGRIWHFFCCQLSSCHLRTYVVHSMKPPLDGDPADQFFFDEWQKVDVDTSCPKRTSLSFLPSHSWEWLSSSPV